MKGKLFIFSAPSGSGKTTIVKHLLSTNQNLSFSVSATSRPPRGNEKNGIDYHFLSPEEFKQRIENKEFLEWEEVYTGIYYGTLTSEVEKLRNLGQHVIFDVDVIGGCNIKKHYGEKALAVFVKPPSVDELRKRLVFRSTDSKEVIESRIAKAEYELSFETKFDIVLINENLDEALKRAEKIVQEFLGTGC